MQLDIKSGVLVLSLIVFTVGSNSLVKADTTAQQVSVAVPQIGGDEELAQQRCEDSPATMSACLSFIKGFLQGALLTDAAIIESIGAQQRSSFKERALKTRTSRRDQPPTVLAGFCLPPDRTILDLANETLDHVKESKRNSKELAINVYDSLKRDYPCR